MRVEEGRRLGRNMLLLPPPLLDLVPEMMVKEVVDRLLGDKAGSHVLTTLHVMTEEKLPLVWNVGSV